MDPTNTIGEALAGLPTLSTGQAFSLKAESRYLRVWLARVGPEDGLDPWDAVAIECRELARPGWVDVASLRADVPIAFLGTVLRTRCGLPPGLASDVAAALRELLAVGGTA